MEIDLASEAEQIQRPPLAEPVNQPPQQDDLFVWPWTGVIVNIQSTVHDSGRWLKKFSKYNPADVHKFLNGGDRIA